MYYFFSKSNHFRLLRRCLMQSLNIYLTNQSINKYTMLLYTIFNYHTKFPNFVMPISNSRIKCKTDLIIYTFNVSRNLIVTIVL